MLDRQQFAEQLRLCADKQHSIATFDEWFEESSWNVHQQNDILLENVVFEIESLYTAFSEGRISEKELLAAFLEFSWVVMPYSVPPREKFRPETSGGFGESSTLLAA
jgi:hypothetical protein